MTNGSKAVEDLWASVYGIDGSPNQLKMPSTPT